MSISVLLFTTRSEQEIFDLTVKGIRALGFDRLRLYLLSEDRLYFIGKASIRMGKSFVGSQWRVTDDRWVNPSQKAPLPHIFKRNHPGWTSFEVGLKDEGVKEWVWVPLTQAESVIGGLSVDNQISSRPIKEETADLLALFASQVAAALASIRNSSKTGRRARNLNDVLQISTKVNSLLDLDRILNTTCQSAVELLGVSHSGFVRFEPDFKTGKVYAEFPDMKTVGQQIPLSEIAAWEDFIANAKPFIVHDVENEPSLGQGREILLTNDIRSVLIVPVIGRNGMLGSFGLDSIGATRHFTEEEVELCQVFAEQVAVAIENAERFRETKQQVEQLEKLRRTTLAITSSDRDTLLNTIIHQAIVLLKAKSSGIYQYNPESDDLTVIVDYNRQDQVGKTLKRGEGMAGRLLQNGEPFMIVDNYNIWDGKAAIYADGRRFGAVLEVPLRWQKRFVGVLYIDDVVGRKFTPKEARLLGLLANQAVITLVNVNLLDKDEQRLMRLKMLARATDDIMRSLGQRKLDELLSIIAKHATEILNAETCGVFLVSHETFLSLEASYGHAVGRFQKGLKLPIRSGRASGFTGHVASEGKLFNMHGEALRNHVAARGGQPYHSPSGSCYSLLAIPLKKKIGKKDKLIGLLRIDNKKGPDGRPLSTLSFTQEDEWILSIFAETVVLALESAGFIEQVGKQQESLQRFLDSSPNGIIAVDIRGNVTGFNRQAEAILGYTANEVLHTSVDKLYYDERESHRIGEKLGKARDGKIVNYDTFVRSKQGKRIAIRLSATWINDAEGQRIGSVGYFDRSIREIQALLLQEGDDVTRLQKLAEEILLLVPHTFCRILLMDESKQFLVVEAAHPIWRREGRKNWNPRLKEHIFPSEWMGLDKVLAEAKPRAIRWNNERSRPNLQKLSRLLNLDKDVQSLLLVPLKIEDRDIGLIEIGELRSEERSSFPQAEIELLDEFAAQTKILIMMSLYRITNRHKEELERLHEAAKAMTGIITLKDVLRTIVEQAKEVFSADSSALWPYNDNQNRFIPDDAVAVGIPNAEFQRFREKQPEPGHTAYTLLEIGWLGIPKLSSPQAAFLGQSTRELLKRIKVKSFQGVALKVANEPVGVLYVNYKQPRTFSEADRRSLENFAAYAALALRRARLLHQLDTAKFMSEVVASMTALGEQHTATLDMVTAGTKSAVGCDAVVLYTYDQSKEELDYPPKHVGVNYPGDAWPYSGVPTNSFVYKMLQQDEPYTVERVAEDEFFKKSRFARDEGIESCIVIPLEVAGQKVGVMFVNYRMRHRFTNEDRNSIKLFADQAAVAISNAQLYDQSQRRAEALDGLYHASNAIIGSLSLKSTLNQISQQALRIVGVPDDKKCFSHVALRMDNTLEFKAASAQRVVSTLRQGYSKIYLNKPGSRPGIAGLAALTGRIQNIGEVRHCKEYIPLKRYIHSQLSVPLKIDRKVIGVLSIEHSAPNAFNVEDERNVELLATQAAIAIQNAEQHEITKRAKDSLEALHQAAEAMAGEPDLGQVLNIIVNQAKEMFQADSSALWPYDDVQGRFIRDEPVANGISDRELQKLTEEEPKPGRTSYTVLEKGWVGLPNISEPEADFLGQSTRELLKRIKVKSFQGVALKVANEPVGVLYVNYKQPRTFGEADQHQIENFAKYAALSLLKARLSYETKTANLMSYVAASMTALGNFKGTLLSVTKGTQAAVGCDAVVLYAYDQIKKKLHYPPEFAGVRDPQSARSYSEVPTDSLEYLMLQRDEPYIVEEISKDKLFKGKRFALREHIASCVAIPLITAGQKVGVMFVNYRTRHRFSKNELLSIQLFSNQAAVAISNAQLYQQEQRRGEALAALSDAGRSIIGSSDLTDMLYQICQQALRVIKTAREGCFSHVGLRRGHALHYISANSKEVLETLRRNSAKVSLRRAASRSKKKRPIGIAGRAVLSGELQNVPDVRKDRDYNLISPTVRSQLSVPLKTDKGIIGVLTIEHPDFDAFSLEDEQKMKLLALQAAVAVQKAEQVEELQKTLAELKKTKGQVGSLTALAWMGMATNTWRHSIEGCAINARNAVSEFLRPEIRKSKLSPAKQKQIEEWLGLIETEAQTILERPITPPLSDEEGVEPIAVNDFIRGWIKEYWRNKESAGRVKPVFNGAAKNAVSINCSRDWLGRAFDLLADNAIKAMANSPTRRLTITSRVVGDNVRIVFTDTGRGIPRNIRTKLFNERIKKPKRQGMGMGLLMVKAIVETYEGDVRIESTGPGGTAVMIILPVGKG